MTREIVLNEVMYVFARGEERAFCKVVALPVAEGDGLTVVFRVACYREALPKPVDEGWIVNAIVNALRTVVCAPEAKPDPEPESGNPVKVMTTARYPDDDVIDFVNRLPGIARNIAREIVLGLADA